MNDLLRRLVEIDDTPWALESTALSLIAIAAKRAASEPSALRGAAPGRGRAGPMRMTGSTAVIQLQGIMSQRGNWLDALLGPGSTSTDETISLLRDALDDQMVERILIDVDSPGGSVYGVMELADFIYQARAKKPITAIANSMAASAAYWIGAQASELYVTPGGEVGSIGVLTTHTDKSEAFKQMGLKTTIISAGKNKVEGNTYGPLEDDARAFLQSRVDDIYGRMTLDIARGRGVSTAQVRQRFGGGRMLGAEDALQAGMVDGICTFAQLLARPVASTPRLDARRAQLARLIGVPAASLYR